MESSPYADKCLVDAFGVAHCWVCVDGDYAPWCTFVDSLDVGQLDVGYLPEKSFTATYPTCLRCVIGAYRKEVRSVRV